MRRGLLTLLALVGVGCALVVTASSTMAQAVIAGMSGPVPAALVGLLEVVNVAGTWTWITDPRPRVRLEAALGVAAASTVTAVCGAMTYGPLGLVAPLGLLAAVHFVSRMWTVPAAELVVAPGSGASAEVATRRDGVQTPTPGTTTVEPVVGEPHADSPPNEPVRIDQQHGRRRPRVVASTAEGRAGPAADRAA